MSFGKNLINVKLLRLLSRGSLLLNVLIFIFSNRGKGKLLGENCTHIRPSWMPNTAQNYAVRITLPAVGVNYVMHLLKLDG